MFTKKNGFILTIIAVMLFTLTPSALAQEETETPRNLAAESSYQYSAAPNESYPDSGNELTDGVYEPLEYVNPGWQGHLRGITREVVFDLQDFKSINAIKAHFMQDSNAGIFYPVSVSMYVSDDGQNWGTLAHRNTQIPLWEPGPATEQFYIWDAAADGLPHPNKNASSAYARYVKITFTTQTWTFLDEIEIWGTDGKAKHAVRIKPEEPAYLEPGKDTNGIRDLVLLYNGWYPNGEGIWTKDKIIPYISYVDQQGEPADWFYDGVLYLGLLTPGGERNFGSTALFEDWQWYLDTTFGADGDMKHLNDATAEVGQKLGDPKHRTKVVLMIPNPDTATTDFGDVDGDGISENFNPDQVGAEAALHNRQKAVSWYMDQVKQRWSAAGYSNLELSGMYWLAESAWLGEQFDEPLIRYTSDLVHSNHKQKFFWIPHFYANGSFAKEQLGFDAVALQPNHFFNETEATRLEDAAGLARQYGIGVEFETDERMNTDQEMRKRFIEYLNGGVDYGYMTRAFKAYYQGNTSLLDSSRSSDPTVRSNYDFMYQFVKGTYVKQTVPGPAE